MIRNKISIIPLLIAWAFIIFNLSTLHAQYTIKKQPIRVLVDKFGSSNILDSANFNSDISGFIKLSLLKYPSIYIVRNDSLEKTARINLNSNQQYYNNLLNNVDYILSGDYNITGNKIVITINLYKKDCASRSNYYSGEIDKIGTFMDELGRQISSRIFESDGIIKATEKNIAIIYHLNGEDYKNTDKSIYSGQLTRSIITGFPEIKNIKLMSRQNTEVNTEKTGEDLLTKLNIDGCFDLNFNFEQNGIISVSPVFVFKNNFDQAKSEITLPEYSSDYYQNFDFTTFLINELSGFLNAFYNIDRGNEYAYSPDLLDRNDPFAFMQSISSQGNLFKSDYFIYKFFEERPELADSAKIKFYNLLGENKFKETRVAEAEQEFMKVLTLDQGNYTANIGMAKIKLIRYDYEGTLNQIASLPLSNEIYLIKGQAYYGLGNLNDAKENLEKVNSTDKEDQYTKSVYLGTVYLELEDPDKALQIYRNQFISDSSDVYIRYLYGYLLANKGIDEYKNENFKGAVDYLLAAKRIYKNRDVIDYLRLAYINDHQFKEALDLIENEIQSGDYSPDDIYLTHALDLREIFIDTLRKSEVPGEQVILSLDKHISFNPDDPYGYYYKGNTLTRLGKSEEGLAQMEIAYNKDSTNVSTQLDLMELYLLNNKFAECQKFYQRVMTNDKKKNQGGQSDRDVAIMDYLLISSLKIQNKDYTKYENELNKLLQKNVIINFWDYSSYEAWLKTCNCSTQTREYLTGLTEKMKNSIRRSD